MKLQIRKIKTLPLVLFILGVSNFVIGQDENKPEDSYTYVKNDFSIGFGMGLNKSEFTLLQGTYVPTAPLAVINELDLTYTIKLKNDFALVIRGGIGLYPFVFDVENTNVSDPNIGTLFDYKKRNNYNTLSTLLEYNYWLKKKWVFRGAVGPGIRGYGGAYNGFTTDLWSFEHVYATSPLVSGQIEFGVERLLKNKDLIGLSVGYTCNLGQVFTGTYEIFENNVLSTGSVRNKGHFTNLAFRYTFTKSKKRRAIEDIFKRDDKTSFKEAWQVYRKDRRFIDPKSVFIGVSGGLSFLLNLTEKDPFFKSSHNIGAKFGLTTEIGLKKNRFIEFAITGGHYSNGFKIIYEKSPVFTFTSASLIALELQGGYGIRLINKKGFNLFDVSAGLKVGVHNTSTAYVNPFGSGSQLAVQLNKDENKVLYLKQSDEIKRTFFPLIYAKVERNFRITSFLYFSMAAQYNLGFYPISTKEISYSLSSGFMNPTAIQVKLNGTGLQCLFGFKYKFVPNKK